MTRQIDPAAPPRWSSRPVVLGWYFATDTVPTQLHLRDAVRRPRCWCSSLASQRLRMPEADGLVYRRGRGRERPRRARSTGTGLRAAARDGDGARLRAVLAASRSAPPAWSTTAGSSSAATSRTRRTASALCAECGLVSALHATGGGRLVAVACVDGARRAALMPCGRCRQLLWENGGAGHCCSRRRRGVRPMTRGAAATPSAPTTCSQAVSRRSSRDLDAVDVIRTKRDGGELTDEQIDWVIDAYTRGEVADEQMSALAMAILLNGMNRREIARWTAAMIALRRADGLLVAGPADRRQALHRRRRRQDHAAAGAAGRRLRRRRAAAVRPRARPHRRHAGQARVDPGLAGGAVQRGDARACCATSAR